MKRKCKICLHKLKIKYRNIYDNRHGYPGKFSIYECINCGFMQTEPQLTLGKLSSIYTSYYPKRDTNIKGIIDSVRHLPSIKEINRQGNATDCDFQTKKKQKVLDVGCGTCRSLLVIKKMGGGAWGLDLDKNSQNVAKKLKLNFHLGTIHDCRFPKKYFDLITASQVFEHEGDPENFLKDCKPFLKPKGEIIMSFPNNQALFRYLWGRRWLHWHLPYHLNHFSKKSISIVAEKAGLKITNLKTVTPNLWTVLQVRSYLNNPKEGQRDLMWDGGGNNTNSSGRNLKEKILSTLLNQINKFLFLNRIIDYFGLGESFVVKLKINN